MKRFRPNVKYIVKKYHAEISAWRDPGPLLASWEAITRELAGREGLTKEEQPTAEGVRVAWGRLQSLDRLPTLPTNAPNGAAHEPFSNVLSHLPTLATLTTNRPLGPVNSGHREIQPPSVDEDIFSSDHKRQMQAALERGNLDDL